MRSWIFFFFFNLILSHAYAGFSEIATLTPNVDHNFAYTLDYSKKSIIAYGNSHVYLNENRLVIYNFSGQEKAIWKRKQMDGYSLEYADFLDSKRLILITRNRNTFKLVVSDLAGSFLSEENLDIRCGAHDNNDRLLRVERVDKTSLIIQCPRGTTDIAKIDPNGSLVSLKRINDFIYEIGTDKIITFAGSSLIAGQQVWDIQDIDFDGNWQRRMSLFSPIDPRRGSRLRLVQSTSSGFATWVNTRTDTHSMPSLVLFDGGGLPLMHKNYVRVRPIVSGSGEFIVAGEESHAHLSVYDPFGRHICNILNENRFVHAGQVAVADSQLLEIRRYYVDPNDLSSEKHVLRLIDLKTCQELQSQTFDQAVGVPQVMNGKFFLPIWSQPEKQLKIFEL